MLLCDAPRLLIATFLPFVNFAMFAPEVLQDLDPASRLSGAGPVPFRVGLIFTGALLTKDQALTGFFGKHF